MDYIFFLGVSMSCVHASASICADETQPSRLISGQMFETLTATSMLCSTLCWSVSSCESSSWSSTTRLCQLSRETRISSPMSFSGSQQHLYTELLSQPCTMRDGHPCTKRPCGYNEMCVAVQRGTAYRCFDIGTWPSEDATSSTTTTTSPTTALTTPASTTTDPESVTEPPTTTTEPTTTTTATATTTTPTTTTTTITTATTTTTTTMEPTTTSTSTTTTSTTFTTTTTTEPTTTTTTPTTTTTTTPTTTTTTTTPTTTTTTTTPTTTTTTTTTTTMEPTTISTSTTTTTTPASSCSEFERYIDRSTGLGNPADEMHYGKTATQCEDACAVDPACVMYSYGFSACGLFHSTMDPADMIDWNGVTSGIKCSAL